MHDRLQRSSTHAGVAARRVCAFTLIELLVVIAVIGLLIAAVALIGGHVMHAQKVHYTRAIMQNLHLAIDQFAAEDPLHSIYSRKEDSGPNRIWGDADDVRPTFGPYPPYQLHGATTAPAGSVMRILEPRHPLVTGAPWVPLGLGNRVARDLSGQASPTVSDWTSLTEGPGETGDDRDDIRALYTYLRVYSPGVLAQVPDEAISRMDIGRRLYVNPTGGGTDDGDEGRIDIMGITDAWGVPLDYFLYVKLEWGPRHVSDPTTGGVWRVVDRKPVLRSRGVEQEVADAERDTKEDWIFSEPFPSPAAATVGRSTGTVGAPTGDPGSANGWVRAVPNMDLNPALPADDPALFGYVP